MLKLTIRAEDTADLQRQINELALNQGSHAKETLHAQIQLEQDAQELADPEFDAKYTLKQFPANEAEPTKSNGKGVRGRPRKAAPAAPAKPEPAELEELEEEPEIPPLDVLKQSITNAVIADKNPKGKVRAAVETLKPKLKVDFIAKCDESHRAALWAFVQETGIEVL